MHSFLQDVRFAARLLARSPGFAVVVVLTLALGIGANTAIFSVLHVVLLKPLPYEKPDKLVALWVRFTGIGAPKDQNWVSVPELMDLRGHARAFSHIAAIRGAGFNVRVGDLPERVTGARVSPAFFPALGVKARLGRVFLPEEEQTGRDNVVILSHALWLRRFGGDPGVIGRALQLDGQSVHVAGVMPPGFQYPDQAELWAPLAFQPQEMAPSSRGNHGLQVLARIRDDVSFAQAQADLAGVSRRIIEGAPEYPYERVGFRVLMNPLIEEMVGDVRPALLVLMTAVSFVLLIACTNVAHLLLARASGRQREIAVRTALGAGQGRLLRQLLTESLLLSLAGAVAGLLLARWTLAMLTVGLEESYPRLAQAGLSLPVLGFTLLVAVAASVVFGLAPSLHATGGPSAETLKEGGRSAAGARHGLNRALVVAEVAVSLVLLIGAGLLVKSFLRLLEVDPGFRTERILTLRISLSQNRYADDWRTRNYFRELRKQVEGLPGVESAGFLSALPLTGMGGSGTTTLDTQAVPPDQASPEADRRIATPGLFETLGIALVRGRYFDERDSETSQLVAIIDETMAKTFWPREDALGKRLKFGGAASAQPWRTVVGVVRHVRYRTLESPSRVEVYLPHAQMPQRGMSLAVRTAGDPQALAEAVQRRVLSLDPDQPVYAVRTLEAVVGASMMRRRLSMMLLAVFAGLSLLLVTVGVYGVFSCSVERRVREVGIRMALGASRGQVMRMVMRQSSALVLAGVAAGLAAGLVLTRLMNSLLYDTGTNDPVTFVAVAAILAGAATLASYLPARRATRIDPMTALRCE